MARHKGRQALSGAAVVIMPECHTRVPHPLHRRAKKVLSPVVAFLLRSTEYLRRNWRRLFAHAALSSAVSFPVDASTVVLGKATVCGTGNVRVGRNVLLYPSLYLETQHSGSIDIGDNVVISSGTHIVSMAKVTIGKGSLIGEYVSIRDANHLRAAGPCLRDAGYTAGEIIIEDEVWIGRGVTVLQGVRIGRGASVGANAVVTRDVPANAVVAGVPARRIPSTRLTGSGDWGSLADKLSASSYYDCLGEEMSLSLPQTNSSPLPESR